MAFKNLPPVPPTLPQQMRALAAAGHSRAEELIAVAAKYESTSNAYHGGDTTISPEYLIETWLAARRCIYECSQPDNNVPESWRKK